MRKRQVKRQGETKVRQTKVEEYKAGNIKEG